MKKLTYLFLGLLIVACSSDDNNNETQEQWLLVHTATEATATNSTTLVMPLTNDIFAFTDRPYRDYLYLDGEVYASLWDENEETDNFYTDPPNAVLTWVDGDEVKEVEVVITDADFDGDSNPIGLEFTVTTSATLGTGTLTITLRHEPSKSATGVSDGDITNAGGETDIQDVFSISVE